MFGNGISFSGLASGLDTQAIIKQLVALERIPIQTIEIQREESRSKISLVGQLKSMVEALQSEADNLRSAANFFTYSVGMSQDNVADISAGGAAQAGTHTIQVTSTASIDRWAFDAAASDTIDLASAAGQGISFDVNGTSYSLTVEQDESSLTEIASAINNMAGDDVTASVVNVGTDSAPSYQLVMTSKTSGEDGVLTNISSTISGLTIDGSAGSTDNITPGKNATAVIDGLRVTRSDNDFSDVIEGVSIDVLTTNATEMTFTVEADKSAIREKIEKFIGTYNAVVDFINGQNTYDEESGPGGNLFGDSLLRSVRNQINTALFDVDLDTVSADTDGYSTLSLVGIRRDNDGRLSIDSATFDEKISGDLAQFADLFIDYDGFERLGDEPNTEDYFTDATEDSGLADVLYRTIDRMFGSFEGPLTGDGDERLVVDSLFDARTEALNASVKRFDQQIEAKERLLEQFEQNLIARFAALEELMGGLNAQGAALNSALLSLPTPNRS